MHKEEFITHRDIFLKEINAAETVQIQHANQDLEIIAEDLDAPLFNEVASLYQTRLGDRFESLCTRPFNLVASRMHFDGKDAELAKLRTMVAEAPRLQLAVEAGVARGAHVAANKDNPAAFAAAARVIPIVDKGEIERLLRQKKDLPIERVNQELKTLAMDEQVEQFTVIASLYKAASPIRFSGLDEGNFYRAARVAAENQSSEQADALKKVASGTAPLVFAVKSGLNATQDASVKPASPVAQPAPASAAVSSAAPTPSVL